MPTLYIDIKIIFEKGNAQKSYNVLIQNDVKLFYLFFSKYFAINRKNQSYAHSDESDEYYLQELINSHFD